MLLTTLSIVLLAAATPAATLKHDAPAAWTAKPVASSMRVADFLLPKADGDSEDATLTVYYFGGTGGSVRANLERWISQIDQPDGKNSKDVAKTATLSSNGFSVTTVDVSGTYVAETSPGSGQRLNKAGFRLRAAVLEDTRPAKAGPYFLKLVGPANTVAKWDAGWLQFVKSLRVE